MHDSLENTGIRPEALQRFIDEQIYTLAGTDRHAEVFTILLTGSRAVGIHTEESDIDIDVLCPESTFDSVHAAALKAGIVASGTTFFRMLSKEDASGYFGARVAGAHFSLTTLETVERQLRQYEDVPLWIYTHAKVIEDPNAQFAAIVSRYRQYPKDTLIRKIKYHWLAAGYWAIDVFPHHHRDRRDLLAAATAMLNSINEYLRFFHLVHAKPYPYLEKLMPLAAATPLGRQFCPFFQELTELIVASTQPAADVWGRLDTAFRRLCCSDLSEDAKLLQDACSAAMIAAGLDPNWVKADYNNIDELLQGRLGPFVV